jgi:hypothetical protein
MSNIYFWGNYFRAHVSNADTRPTRDRAGRTRGCFQKWSIVIFSYYCVALGDTCYPVWDPDRPIDAKLSASLAHLSRTDVGMASAVSTDDALVWQLIDEITSSLQQAKVAEKEKDALIEHLQRVVESTHQECRKLAGEVEAMGHELEATAQAKHELAGILEELVVQEHARERELATKKATTAEATDLHAARVEELSLLHQEAEEAREAVRQAETARSQAECELLELRAKLTERDQELIVKSAEAFEAITAAERAEGEVRLLRAARAAAEAEHKTERASFDRTRAELAQLAAHREDQFNAERENVDALNAQVRWGHAACFTHAHAPVTDTHHHPPAAGPRAQVRILEDSSQEFMRAIDAAKEGKVLLAKSEREMERECARAAALEEENRALRLALEHAGAPRGGHESPAR